MGRRQYGDIPKVHGGGRLGSSSLLRASTLTGNDSRWDCIFFGGDCSCNFFEDCKYLSTILEDNKTKTP